MTIRVLGSGCKSCKRLYALVLDAAKELHLEGEILYVTDMAEIAKSGVMSTPALEIDGLIKIAGRVPGKTEMINLLSTKGKSQTK